MLTICMLIVATTISFAQGGAAKKREETKKGLLEQAKLTEAQVTLVMDIEAEFKPKMKAIKDDTTLDEAAKKVKNAELRKEKNKKFETALGKDIAKRVEEFYANSKKKERAKPKSAQ